MPTKADVPAPGLARDRYLCPQCNGPKWPRTQGGLDKYQLHWLAEHR